MGFPAGKQPDDLLSLPTGVTPINSLRRQRQADRTLSKAISLHLEGQLEGAADERHRPDGHHRSDGGTLPLIFPGIVPRASCHGRTQETQLENAHRQGHDSPSQ